MRLLLANLLIRRGELTVAHLTYGENATKWSNSDKSAPTIQFSFSHFRKAGPID